MDEFNEYDFDVYHIDELKPGMLINMTTVKNQPAENFLVLNVEPSEFSTAVKVLASDGHKDMIIFPNVTLSGDVYKVRAYPKDV